MSRALRPLADRLRFILTTNSSSPALNSRASSSLQNVRPSNDAVRQQQQPPACLEFPDRESFGGMDGGMDLMAVPKRKVTPSRKGKRNGGKFLKSVPVIAKCTVCGRVKLPHFYCCDGQVKG